MTFNPDFARSTTYAINEQPSDTETLSVNSRATEIGRIGLLDTILSSPFTAAEEASGVTEDDVQPRMLGDTISPSRN